MPFSLEPEKEGRTKEKLKMRVSSYRLLTGWMFGEEKVTHMNWRKPVSQEQHFW
jgi:hypothetical protein